jgi:hypothetical protein
MVPGMHKFLMVLIPTLILTPVSSFTLDGSARTPQVEMKAAINPSNNLYNIVEPSLGLCGPYLAEVYERVAARIARTLERKQAAASVELVFSWAPDVRTDAVADDLSFVWRDQDADVEDWSEEEEELFF